MNIELLKRTAAYMLQYPEGVDMDTWAEGTYIADKQDGPLCGTTACIAGTAWALEHGSLNINYLIDVEKKTPVAFRELLGLDLRSSMRLFYSDDWPVQFRRAYETARDPQARAQVVHDRIYHFIETGA